MRSEEDIVKKALGKTPKKSCHVKIPYVSTEQLIDDLTTLYPTINELFIYNHDLRDQEGSPVLTTKNHRRLKATIHTFSSHTYLEAKWRVCFVAVEGSWAYVKLSTLSLGLER